MATLIALYRGLNVGGNAPVKMDALRAMHERVGHRQVKNYIQSGNIVFAAKGSAAAIARRVAAEFAETFGFPAKVLIVDTSHLGAIVRENPYAKFAALDPRKVHVGFCDGRPDLPGLKALLAKTGGREQFTIVDRVVYLHAPDGFGTSKFAKGMEKACGVPMTVRNWRTIEALWKLAGESAADSR
jgi:uncharacterized protein (DUF1697 family)